MAFPMHSADPTLELHDGTGALIGSNNNWQDDNNRRDYHELTRSSKSSTADGLPTDGRESAIIANLLPGNYTAIVRGVNNTVGVALVEVYDLQ